MSDTPDREPATRESWPNLHPLPAEHVQLMVERSFTQHEYAQIARGCIPEAMEDKWFIYLEDMTLYIHRSWTGFCIFQVRLEPRGATYAIAQVLVNRDPGQYKHHSDAYDQQVLLFLLNHLLLGAPYALPIPSGVPAGLATALYHQHVAGAGHKPPKPLELKDLWRWFWRWLWWLVKPR